MDISRPILVLCASLALALACDDGTTMSLPDGGPKSRDGERCARTTDCVTGLICTGYSLCKKPDKTLPGTRGPGQECASYVDCLRDLTCSSFKRCVKQDSSKGGKTGQSCTGHENCAPGLLCSSAGKCANRGDPYTKDLGDSCTQTDDCAPGLLCVKGKCSALTYWAGSTCAKPSGTFRALFEIPRSGKTVSEFYRLPFPNDIRVKDGKVDVTGHPNPGSLLVGDNKSIVGNILAAINADVAAFGLQTATFLRLSHAYEMKSIILSGTNPTIEFLNIDKKSSSYGKALSYALEYTTGRLNRYICDNYLSIRPHTGQPLDPSTTYAVLLRKGIRDSKSTEAAQDADFKIMLQTGEPSGADEKAAWQAYAPLRAYLKDKGIAENTLISAAVFTTMDPRARMAELRARILDKVTAPTLQKLTLCDGSTKSPCDDGQTKTHVCPSAPNANFHELHGLLSVPVMQTGTRPYKTPADGGYMVYDKDGKPEVQSSENVCVAITIPKGAGMPSSGWPVVMFAPGTGGNMRSFVGTGTALALSNVKDAGNASNSARMAVISIDGAMNGPRTGSSAPAEELFFNLLNPRASRDNVYQGAADKFQLMRVVTSLDLTGSASPTRQALKFNTKRVYFFGHSQGTIEGIPFLTYEPGVAGAVLSGAGGFLAASVMDKTKPLNVAGALRLALADPRVNLHHPMINLLQLVYEEVDSSHYGQALYTSPLSGVGRKSVFFSMGLNDHYTPPLSSSALAWIMRIRRMTQDAARCGDKVCTGSETCVGCTQDCGQCLSTSSCGDTTCEKDKGETCRNCPTDCTCFKLFAEVAPPVKGNEGPGSAPVTAAMVQYVSHDGSYDDHFVVFQNDTARTQANHFLGSGVWNKDHVPTIPKEK